MDDTRHTLLQRAGLGEAGAWDDLTQIYQPFIFRWFLSQGLQHDADDLTQEVITALLRELPEFQHSGRTGAFRSWLRTTCLHRLQDYRRKVSRHAKAVGGTEFLDELHNVAESNSEMEAKWDREHGRAVLRRLFELLSAEFDSKTLEAFQQLAVAGQSANEVAANLGMSVGAVYVAKSRVMRRLREEAADLIDTETLDKANSTSPTV